MGKVQSSIDTLCCVLPFEEPYFRKQRIHAVYVGHPMFDAPANAAENDPAAIEPPLPGLAPRGSSNGQIPRTPAPSPCCPARAPPRSPTICRRCSRCWRNKEPLPAPRFVAAAASEERTWQIRSYLSRSPARVDVRVGITDAIIRWADLVLSVSGTATLQIAKHHTPMIVMYAVAAYKWHLLGRHLIRTQYLSLVNILADRELVPEYMPFYGSPLPMAREAIAMLGNPDLRTAMSRDLAALVRPLSPEATGGKARDRVAVEITKLLNRQ